MGRLDEQERRIQLGNPPTDAEMVPPRDLSMRQKEHWETRPSPGSPHHWTRGEIERHLHEHRFPPNTIRDRVSHHTIQIRNALIQGLYVPPEVVQDVAGQEAIRDAIIHVRAFDDAEQKASFQAENSKSFLAALDCQRNRSTSLSDLLYQAAKAPQVIEQRPGLYQWATGGYKQVQLDGYPHPVLVCHRIIVGRHWIQLQDGRYDPNSLFASLHRLSLDEAANLYDELRDDLSLSEIASVLGSEGMRYLDRPVIRAVYPRN